MTRAVACLLAMMMILRPAWAQDYPGRAIPGQSDPAFARAVAVWLEDDEAAALPALAALAGQGNRAAQVLLAQVDKVPSLQGPWLGTLPRADRIALLRAPGGLSGTNWMRMAAADVPIATLWLRLWDASDDAGLVLDFVRAGEARAARVAVLALRARQSRGLETLGQAADFPASMRFILWEAALPSMGLEALSARARAEAAFLPPGDPQRVIAGIDDSAAPVGWFAQSDVTVPLDGLCLTLCPETYDTCTAAAMGAVGGYRGLVALGSPVEALIDTRVYAASPKGRADLLRRALLRLPVAARDGFITRAVAYDACLGAALAAENERY